MQINILTDNYLEKKAKYGGNGCRIYIPKKFINSENLILIPYIEKFIETNIIKNKELLFLKSENIYFV